VPSIVCQGCGTPVAEGERAPFRCPRAGSGDDVDHVLVRSIDPAPRFPDDRGEKNPFIRYRTLFHSHARAMASGMRDDEYVALVRRLDRKIAEVDGHGFVATPFGRSASLSERFAMHEPGGIFVKDETRNVSGSHKARHLFGLAIFLEVVGTPRTQPLAIASCGNAALAAAVVARACERTLEVFIPVDADPNVVARLRKLEAKVHVCAREAGVAGDPCYHAFRRAVDAGAVPFCCQGSDNGLTIEGGETIGFEIISDLLSSERRLDRLFVQVGGGALASACVAAFRDARKPVPRLHAVQTLGGHPLQRAYQRVLDRLKKESIDDALKYAATHRSEFMWPWETEPKSIAHGILDDETYDWLAIVRAMIETGGHPVIVDEATLKEANAIARKRTGIDVDPTGSSGLAGALAMHEAGALPTHESIGVIFSGVTRHGVG